MKFRQFVAVLGLALGLNPNAALASDQALEKLGQKIFEDTSLSEPADQACASCHVAKQAFTGNFFSSVAAVAQGSTVDKIGTRNGPTIMYMSFSPAFHFAAEKNDKGEIEYTPTGGQFWDGRADDLNAQALGPLTNPVEMSNPNLQAVANKLAKAPYGAEFESRFGKIEGRPAEKVAADLGRAIAAFERSVELQPFSSKFDDVLRGTAKFNAQEARGFGLFKDPQKGNCIGCHVGNEKSNKPSQWLFTDFTYDGLGVPRNGTIPANADAAHYDLGLCQRDKFADVVPKGQDPQSFCGQFKVPTLRNIAATAPYFHNGAIGNLRDAVKFYVTRDTNPELWYSTAADGTVMKFDDSPESAKGNVNTAEVPYDRKPGEQPRLNDAEIDDLVAFLKTLTDKGVEVKSPLTYNLLVH